MAYSLPYTEVNGTLADATQVYANFVALLNGLNNSLAKDGSIPVAQRPHDNGVGAGLGLPDRCADIEPWLSYHGSGNVYLRPAGIACAYWNADPQRRSAWQHAGRCGVSLCAQRTAHRLSGMQWRSGIADDIRGIVRGDRRGVRGGRWK